MANLIYLNARYILAQAATNLSTDNLYLALFTSSYSPAINTDIAYGTYSGGTWTGLGPPAQPAPSNGSAGGTNSAENEYYVTSYVQVNSSGTVIGETAASAESAVFARTANTQVNLSSPSAPGGSCTKYRVYASTTSGAEKLQTSSTGHTETAIGTGFVLSGALATGTASPLTSSTQTASIQNEVANGNGYTTGGIQLTQTGVAQWSTVLASSATWADVWQASKSYSLGQIIIPASSPANFFKCVHAGQSNSSAPTWGSTVGDITTDNTITWLNRGPSLCVLQANNLSWTASGGGFSYRYGVLYDKSTNDLIACLDPGANQVGPSSGQVQINFDAAGLLVL